MSTALSYPDPPRAVTLDIDDTVDVVHGHQQLSLFNAHYNERCFLPIHVYDTATSRPVAVLLRPGKSPRPAQKSAAICAAWCAASAALAEHAADHSRRRPLRPPRGDGMVRGAKASTTSSVCRATRAGRPGRTGCRRCQGRRAITRRRMSCAAIPRPAMAPNRGAASAASPRGSRQRRKVSISAMSSPTSPCWHRDGSTTRLYCARGQAENLIKLHKTQLASDRTSCRYPLANQVRLVLHTGAYWLMLTLRDAIPHAATSGVRRVHDAAPATDEARRTGHRDRHARTHRLRCRLPEAALFASLARCLQPAEP